MNNESGIASRKFLFKEKRPSRYHSSLPPANDDWSTKNHGCLKISPFVESKQGDVALNERPEQKVQVLKNSRSSPSSPCSAKSFSTESRYGNKQFKNTEETLSSTGTSSTLSRPMYKRRKLTDANCYPETYVDLFSKLENILSDGRKKSIENHLKFMNSVSHDIWGDEDNSCVVESTISNVSTGSWILREQDFSSPGSSNDEMSSTTIQIKNRTKRKIKTSKSMKHNPIRPYTSDTSESSEENYPFKPKSKVVLHNRKQHDDRTQTHQNQRKIRELKMSVTVDGLDDMEMIVYYAKKYPTTRRNVQLGHKDIEITKSITTCIDLVKSIIQSVFPPLYGTSDKPSTQIVDVQTKDCQKEHSEDWETDVTKAFGTNDSKTHITEDQKTNHTKDCAKQNTNDSDTDNIETNNSHKTLNTKDYRVEYNKERARETTTDSETDDSKDIETCNNKDHKTDYSKDCAKENTKHFDTEDTNNSHKTYLTENDSTEYNNNFAKQNTNPSDADKTNNTETSNNNDSNPHINKDHKTEHSRDCPKENTKHSDTEDTNNSHKTHLTENQKTEYTNASDTDETNNNNDSNSHITHSDTEDTNNYETNNTHKTHITQNLITECNNECANQNTTASDTDDIDKIETINNNQSQTHINQDNKTEYPKDCAKEDTKHFNTDDTINYETNNIHKTLINENHNSVYTNDSAKQDTNDSDTDDINNTETNNIHKTHITENLPTEYSLDCEKQNINNSETEDIENCETSDTKDFEPNDAENCTTVHPKEVIGNTSHTNITKHELLETLTSPKEVNGTPGNMSPSTCSVVSEPLIYDRCPNIVDITSSDDSLSTCTTSATFSGQMSKKWADSNKQTATQPPNKSFLELFKQLEEALGDEQ